MQDSMDNGSGWHSTPWRIAAWSIAGGLMLVPIITQLVVGNFGWNAADFIIVAVILGASCLLFDLAARNAPDFSYLAGAGTALAAGFGLFFVNGAVGLVGSEDEAHNLWFFVAVVVAIAGAVIARGRRGTLALTMFAAGLTHIIVSAVLLVRAGGVSDGSPLAEFVGLSFFAALWLASAQLFRNPSRRSG